jgi:hypothetical protein
MPSKGNPSVNYRVQPHVKAELERLAHVLGYPDPGTAAREGLDMWIRAAQARERRQGVTQAHPPPPSLALEDEREGDVTPPTVRTPKSPVQ